MEENFLKRVKFGRPVLEPSYNTEDFDSKGVDCANIIKKDGKFLMFYIG